MTEVLILMLAVAGIAAFVFFGLWRSEADAATRYYNLFNSAQYQLGKVHDALSDIPKDATTPLSEVVFRVKSEGLQYRNQVWEIENLLRVPALEGKKTLPSKVIFLLKTAKEAADGKPVSNRDEDYK